MPDRKPIFEQGLEAYPLSRIIFTNVLMVAWMILGAWACGFFSPLLGWAYLIGAVLAVFVILRKAVCTHCYYYDKWCASGWGKLSALFFSKGDMDRFDTCWGVKSAPLTYGLLLLIPLVFGIIGLVQKSTPTRIGVLVLLVLTGVFSGTVNRKKACLVCKMKWICPGGEGKE